MMGNTVDEHAHKFLEPPNCAEVQNGQNSRSGGAPGSLLGLFVFPHHFHPITNMVC